MQRMQDDDANLPEYWDSSLSINSLTLDYEAGVTPQSVIHAVYERIDAYKDLQPSVWIYLQPIEDVFRAATEISIRWPGLDDRPSLWGVPFSIKDSIDVEGLPTTAGCPPLAFIPERSAQIYQKCIDAGALFIGKTNMEQLATGLTGCRSSYGTLHSTFSKSHIVGGSSSGSAVSVSANLVSFSLATDTAGSVRVPALFNGIVGFKPTKGTVSSRGVMPACLHQDCVSFMATCVEDVEKIWDVCRGFDKEDSFAKLPQLFPELLHPRDMDHCRFSFCTPPASALNACSLRYREEFSQGLKMIAASGGRPVEVDWQPFAGANDLLYNGTFVLERLTILPEGWFEKNKSLLHPITRQVFDSALARNYTALDIFKDFHKQARYKRAVEDYLTFDEAKNELTVMIVPTSTFHPTIEEIQADPIGINSRLGDFAHFANVLDLVAIAVPCGTYEIENTKDHTNVRLPFGVTILAGAGLERELLALSARLSDILNDRGYETEY